MLKYCRFVFGQNVKLGKEKERTDHDKDCKEGCAASQASEGEGRRQARRQRTPQAGCEARNPQVSGPPQGQGRLNRGKRPGSGAHRASGRDAIQGVGIASAHKSYLSAWVTRASTISPGLTTVSPLRNTEPSISGASH